MIRNCPEMSARYYSPLRHDRMGKILCISHIQKHFPEIKVEHLQEPEYIRRVKHTEKLVKYHDQDSSKNTA